MLHLNICQQLMQINLNLEQTINRNSLMYCKHELGFEIDNISG